MKRCYATILLVLTLWLYNTEANECSALEHPRQLTLDDKDIVFFTHIPKCGGRVASWWLANVYGFSHVLPGSMPASTFSGGRPMPGKGRRAGVDPKDVKDVARRVAGYKVAFSHDRPQPGYAFIEKSKKGADVKLFTFLRDVHSHRESMVHKYLCRNLGKALGSECPMAAMQRENAKKNPNKKAARPPPKVPKPKYGGPPRNVSYENWLYLEPGKPWQEQEYARPQIGKQPIGITSGT